MREASSDDDTARRTRVRLAAGDLVILHPHGPAGGFPKVVAVDHITNGRLWFLGACDPIRRSETLTVESPIVRDARYIARATVAASSPETYALDLTGDWERVQQRAFVRITAHGLQVRLVRVEDRAAPPETDAEATDLPDDETAERDSVHALLDISAGGIRFEGGDEYEADEEVICHFELPGAPCFVLPARIVRGPAAITTHGRKPYVAAEFIGLDESSRSQLLRWVYREQVRRHREEARKEEAARKRKAARR